jgi:hypothetical protein
MACFSPLKAYQLEDGEIVFVERGRILRPLFLPCGQCIGCRLERSRQWAVRCLHESQMHEFSSFITLTYNQEYTGVGLCYRDFQLFMKRLRRAVGPVRFYMCGEYGEEFLRPHFHACLFGVFFHDRVFYRSLDSGSDLYRSALLESLWTYGFSSVGDVTFESAAYVARYITKKITGPAASDHYARVDADGVVTDVVPEFTRMSLKPGIGSTWFEKYGSEVFPRDFVVVRGVKCKPPRYYDNIVKEVDPKLFAEVEVDRQAKSLAAEPDSTFERLRVRELVARGRLIFKKRTLE